MSKFITTEIEISNLGPHKKLRETLPSTSLLLGIYANNGIGKTFISRAFRLFQKQPLDSSDSNKILTLSEDEGSFKMKVKNSAEPTVIRECSITIKREAAPIATNNTGYIFHVFNSDYVKDNIEAVRYKPDEKIEGYILSKEKIDLSKEKEELKNDKDALLVKENKIKEIIAEERLAVDKQSVNKNTTEYSYLDYARILDITFNLSELETFASLCSKNNILKGTPPNLPDIKNIVLNIEKIILSEIVTYLSESFPKSTLAEDFIKRVKEKQPFIEEGTKILKEHPSDQCPFCEQNLESAALGLIKEYNEFINDVEAVQAKKANEFISKMEIMQESFNRLYTNFLKLKIEYKRYQEYLPSAKDNSLVEVVNPESIGDAFANVSKILTQKKENVNKAFEKIEFEKYTVEINEWFDSTKEIIDSNQGFIDLINWKKGDIQTEKRELNRRICIAKFNEIRQIHKRAIEEIAKLKDKIERLERDILTKESLHKVNKKEKVAKLFQELLQTFFSSKYTFEESTFCLKLGGFTLTDNASDVLSEGEKGIVAFCYYLAEVYKVVESEEDYKKLFFVIDDPISSLDFHYVYAVSQIIRGLHEYFEIERTKLRCLVLTHNLEFMSILIRNNIVVHKWVLNTKGIVPLKNELIMPYEGHLRDIYTIATGAGGISHTTANSIRHVIETINQFVSPNLALLEFCKAIKGFEKSPFLYSLMQDGSHGAIRSQKAYTDEMIKEGCQTIIAHISENYNGQIKLISKS